MSTVSFRSKNSCLFCRCFNITRTSTLERCEVWINSDSRRYLRTFIQGYVYYSIEPYCNILPALQNEESKDSKGCARIFQIERLTFILGKPMPTKKLAIQLTRTAIDMAAGLGPCENSSAVIIHGMEPGPTAKNTTKLSVDTTDR